jgi:short-subunit dehydrogenase
VLWLGEAANFELRDGGVRVSTLCPGITATEFLEVSGQKATLYQRLVMMRSPDVVRAGLRGLMRGKPCIVPGLVNKLTVWFTRLVPRVAQTRLAYWFMRN